jgi:diguanylate cyclase (GGDEF)-like protein
MSPTETLTGPAPRPERLRDLPVGLRLLIVGVVAGGALALWVSAVTFHVGRPAAFVQMAALALLTSSVKVRLPLKRDVSTMSVSNALVFASLLLLGSASTVVVAAVCAWGQCTFRMRSRNPWHRTAFSVATLSMAAFAAATAFDWIVGVPLLSDQAQRGEILWTVSVGAMLRAVMAAAVVYFAVNSGLIAWVVALSGRQPVYRVWLDSYLWSAPGYFVAAAAGYGTMFVDRLSHAWSALLALPLYLTYRSYRTFIARIEDERAQVRLLSEVQLATIEALALAIEVKDQTSQSHIQRFQIYAEGLSRALRLEEDHVRAVKTAALLHDIGNLAVPEHILSKPGALTDEEFRRLQVHPRVGADIVGAVPFPYAVAPLILSHHEHWDGSGYPSGLAGEAIPIGARILTVVDFFSALLADRPYRPGRSFGDAIATMREHAGTILDPHLVEKFVAILPELEQRVREAHAATLARRQSDARGSRQTESALADIAGTQREGKVLYEIAQTLGSSLGLDDTFNLLAEKLQSLIPFSACALFLRQEDDDRLVCRRTLGLTDDALLHLPPMPYDDLASGPAPTGSSVCFPHSLVAALAQGDRVIGAIAVYHVGPEAYGPEDRRLLDLVAQHAAAVVNNSLVFEQTQEASLTDPLTGLANRRALQLVIAGLSGTNGAPPEFALLMLDLDGLKYLNDTYGHHVGDRAIREVATVLRSRVRPSDLCARYAGDEFVVALIGRRLAEAAALAAELQDGVSAVAVDVGSGQRVRLSISVGAAACPEDGRTQETLVAVADERMYQDKAQRKRLARQAASGLDAA